MANALQYYNLNEEFQLSTVDQLAGFDVNEYTWTGRTLTSWSNELCGVLPLDAAVSFSDAKQGVSANWKLDKDWKVELCMINNGGQMSTIVTEKNELLPLADAEHPFISSATLTSSGEYDVRYNNFANQLCMVFKNELKTNIKSIKYRGFGQTITQEFYNYEENGNIDEAGKRRLMNGSSTPSNVTGTSKEKCFSVSVDYTGDGIIEYYSNNDSTIIDEATIFKVQTTDDHRKLGISHIDRSDENLPIIIDWGDGIIEEYQDEYIENKIHEYASNGTFNVKIRNALEIDAVNRYDNRYYDNYYTLKEIIFGNTIQTIYYEACYGCSSLTSVTIPGSVKDIYEDAFYNCINLVSIYIPDIDFIDYQAFANCNSLTAVTISSTSLTQIASGCFKNCKNIKKIALSQAIYNYGYFSIRSIFSDSKESITDIEILSGSTFISSDSAFAGLPNLTNIIIPEGFIDIRGRGAFNGCSSLISVEIPSTIKNIGYIAFAGCSNLSVMYLKPLVAPTTIYSEFGTNAYAFGDNQDNYTGRNTYDTGKNILVVPENATGYDTGEWLDPLQNPEKCGFNLSVMSI